MEHVSEQEQAVERVAVTEAGRGAAFTVPVWMSREQFALRSHTHLTVDLVRGRGAGFSLETPDGVRFLIRSRLLTSAGEPGEPSGPVGCEVPPPG